MAKLRERVGDRLMMQHDSSGSGYGSTATGGRSRPSRVAATFRSRACLWALLLAQACIPFAQAREPLPDSPSSAAIQSAAGPAIAIGGALRDDNSAVWSRLIDLAGGAGARFVVFATASGDPEAAARGTIAALTAHGAVAEHLRVAPELKGVDLRQAVRDPALIDKVRAANGVFFTGGDQARIVDTLRPDGVESPLLTAIRELQQRGGWLPAPRRALPS